uniref:Uncharacterized protein n=1 Tax=Aegilops tauschii subsp. strangulata TaxID=200361 RepID=A0A453KL99_AEGTS
GDGGPPALLLRAERVRQTRASASATDRHEVLSPKRRLPLRKVPGEHGPPLLGALKDRLEYLHGPASLVNFMLKMQNKCSDSVHKMFNRSYNILPAIVEQYVCGPNYSKLSSLIKFGTCPSIALWIMLLLRKT